MGQTLIGILVILALAFATVGLNLVCHMGCLLRRKYPKGRIGCMVSELFPSKKNEVCPIHSLFHHRPEFRDCPHFKAQEKEEAARSALKNKH